MAWQPIATAPKDETWFFGYRPAPDVGTWDRICVTRWDSREEAFVWPDGVCDIFDAETFDQMIDDGDFYKGTFTHWMPIPAIPD